MLSIVILLALLIGVAPMPENYTPEQIAALRDVAAAIDQYTVQKKTTAKSFFVPYPKQQEFFDAGLTYAERYLGAGNQLGKSEAGAFEVACHLTGEYPDWWLGRRWDRPVEGWACGESALVVRDVQQSKLCGKAGVAEAFGTGMIPKKAFVGKPTLARSVADAYDMIQVRHKSGGVSTLHFKSYEQGRAKFQGPPKDFIWFDEEPDEDIYTEGLARLTATHGMAFLTFTPLNGMSKVVERFLGTEKAPDRYAVTMTIDDVTHITASEIMSRYPAYQRMCRLYGVPMQGEGAIFTVQEASIVEAPIEYVPLHWAKIWGTDFGIEHPFGAVLLLWDRDLDIVHVHHTIRMSGAIPMLHARPMKQVGLEVPVAWPHDGNTRDKGSGKALSTLYRAEGLKMLEEHSHFPDGSISTEAGIMDMDTRMKTGKFKVAAHLSDWFEEFRLYHRKDGQIVKVKDDLLSATRIGLMSLRRAKPVPLGGRPNVRKPQKIADGVENPDWLFG